MPDDGGGGQNLGGGGPNPPWISVTVMFEDKQITITWGSGITVVYDSQTGLPIRKE
jgi:hypothetical protein